MKFKLILLNFAIFVKMAIIKNVLYSKFAGIINCYEK